MPDQDVHLFTMNNLSRAQKKIGRMQIFICGNNDKQLQSAIVTTCLLPMPVPLVVTILDNHI